MKNALFAAALLTAVSAGVAAPTHAEPSRLDGNGVRPSTAAAAPESPLAAFERLFAHRVSAVAPPSAPAAVDPLDAPFHAALWSPAAPSRMSAARVPESPR